MEREDAIEYIENLREGDFLTVNIPIFQDEIAPVTAMYVGKTKDGAYRFVDAGHGLIKIGNALVPFVNKFPKDTELYKLIWFNK